MFHVLVHLLRLVRGRTLLVCFVLAMCLTCLYGAVTLFESRAWGAAVVDLVIGTLFSLWFRSLINRGRGKPPVRVPSGSHPGDQPSPRPIE